MKNSILFIYLLTLVSCNSQNTMDLTHLNYKAQTRGFLVGLSIDQKKIIYNNNGKIDTLHIEKGTWKYLKEITSKLDFETLKTTAIDTELLATDRAILAALTFTVDKAAHQIEFIHGNPPEELKELIHEIFNAVSE